MIMDMSQIFLISTFFFHYVNALTTGSNYKITSYGKRRLSMECYMYRSSWYDVVHCGRLCNNFTQCYYYSLFDNYCFMCFDQTVTSDSLVSTNVSLADTQRIYEKTNFVDECSSSPCVKGRCQDRENGYVCHCDVTHIGVLCEIELVDECLTTPCLNNGQCIDKDMGYSCNCIAPYGGTHCETDTVDECSYNPCVHGSCVDQINHYTCYCQSPYVGTNCDIDECLSSPCVYGTCVNQINQYTCNCASDHYGTICGQPVYIRIVYESWMFDGHSGRLEIFYNGEWGTVCDDSFDATDAGVACRELGYSSGYFLGNALYGTGNIWMDDLGCYGGENKLVECYHLGFGSHNCGHPEDVAISCIP